MDQIKIGKFIASCRKAKGITQASLAEKFGISDRAVSKWENGKSLPDAGIMLDLCELLGISVNELLPGEKIMTETYNKKAEENLLAMKREVDEKNRQLLNLEIIIGTPAMLAGLVLFTVAASVEMPTVLKFALIAFAFVLNFAVAFVAVGIEQKAGFYECRKCHDRHVPTYWQANLAPHIGRSRFMKCPVCGKWNYQKKVISREASDDDKSDE